MTDFQYKLLIFILWPILAPILLFLVVVMFVLAWPAIFFGRVVRKQGGGIELTFK